jgi:hypothetical protein
VADQRELYKGILLYPRIIKKIKANEERLMQSGYKESKKKPLLFYRPTKDCTFFADIRGTVTVPIRSHTSPIFYAQFINTCPNWKKRRILKLEMERLEKKGCYVRLSFYDECEPDGIMFNSEEDGYCKWCGKDFSDNGLYCSEKCELNARRKDLRDIIGSATNCELCKRKIIDWEDEYREIVKLLPDLKDRIVFSKVIEHHTSYKGGITMTVCSSCHAKIHQSNEWCEYTPVDSRSKQHPKTKLVPCSCYGCNNKARVDYNATKTEIENAVCSRCRSKGRAPQPSDEKIEKDIEDAKRRLKDEVKAEIKLEEFDFLRKRGF